MDYNWLPAPPSPSADTEARLQRDRLRAQINAILSLALTPLEYGILNLKLGLEGDPCLTDKEVGDLYGIAPKQIARLYTKASEALSRRPDLKDALKGTIETSRRFARATPANLDDGA